MTVRHILMSASMVQATLREIENPGTGKTQTRRIVKEPPFHHDFEFDGIFTTEPDGKNNARWVARLHKGDQYHTCHIPYAKGDQLYVREAWRTKREFDLSAPRELPKQVPITLEADGMVVNSHHWPYPNAGKFRQGMHMPRWASRITLEVTDVRVQRLQGISGGDVVAEGALSNMGSHCGNLVNCYGPDWCPTDEARSCNKHGCWGVREGFKDLWDSLNGTPRANGTDISWAADPWVVAVSFKPRLQNVDEVTG